VSIERAATEAEHDGFTLIELVVAIAITALVFLGLAMMLAGDLKAIAVQKARSSANEIATQAIEDLQHYDFNDLGVCSGTADPPPSSTPASLASLTPVQLPNCSSTSLVYSQPCAPPSGTLSTFTVPRQTYSCTKNNIGYAIRRYILWSDSSHTGKRLAVFVDWMDAVGQHEISQQSSLRSPNSGSVVGVPPPQFVSVNVSPANAATLDNSGTLVSSISFTANINGTSAGDTVYVTLNTLTTQPDGTVAALPTQFPMSSADGINWSTTLPGSTPPVFGAGAQYVVFTAVRSTSDGKVNSRIAPNTLTLCPSSGCPSGLPTLTGASATTPINIDSAGVLQSTFTISVTANNLDVSSSVAAVIQTQTGAASFPLAYSNSCSNGNNCTTWSATFAPGTINARFLPGPQPFYVTAIDPVAGSGGTNGSSAVTTTNVVTFG
jgi:prepilin-type N-terminal cleavage/methylation domain-containing protein